MMMSRMTEPRKYTWTGRTLEFILDNGYRQDPDGTIVLTKRQWQKAGYKDTSAFDSKQETWCVPSDFGLTLLYKGKHFRVEE